MHIENAHNTGKTGLAEISVCFFLLDAYHVGRPDAHQSEVAVERICPLGYSRQKVWLAFASVVQ